MKTFKEFRLEEGFSLSSIRSPYILGVDKYNDEKQWVIVKRAKGLTVYQVVKGKNTGEQIATIKDAIAILGNMKPETIKNKDLIDEFGLSGSIFEDTEDIKDAINEQITTFKLVGNDISFTTHFVKDRAINILLKLNSFDEKKLKDQLGAHKGNVITFPNLMDSTNAYSILKNAKDIDKITFKDAEEFTDILFDDINKALRGKGMYKFRKEASNAFSILIDGIAVANVNVNPQNKF